ACPRCTDANDPASTARTRKAATPTNSPRNRRFVLRIRWASRSLAWRLSETNSRSSSFRSEPCVDVQSSVADSLAPRYSSESCRPDPSHCDAACVRCCRSWCPCASSSIHPRSRGHSRSNASCATSTVEPLLVTSRSRVSRSSTAAALRGQLDGPTELVHAHRTDRNMVRGQESGELGERRAATVEVAPQRDDRAEPVRRGHGSRRQVLDERGLLVVVGAAGEELLELVHEEHQALVGSRRGDGGAKGTGSGRDGDERRPQLLHGV